MIRRTLATAVLAASAVAGLGFAASNSRLAPPITPSPLTAQQAQASAALAPGTYRVDGVHSSVIFAVQHNDIGRFYGRFNTITGTYRFADDGGSIDCTIPVESVDTNSEGRDRHLKSPDFFNAREHENMTFKSDSIKKTGEKTYEAKGQLTLHGVTKPIDVKIQHFGEKEGRRGGKISGFEARFTIKMSDFGMRESRASQGMSDAVDLIVSLEGRSSG